MPLQGLKKNMVLKIFKIYKNHFCCSVIETMKTITVAIVLCNIILAVICEYIPPGPFYRCPKEKLLLHPCTCDIETDKGISVSCNKTNIASMSIALNNLATFRIPIEKLTIYKCNIGK